MGLTISGIAPAGSLSVFIVGSELIETQAITNGGGDFMLTRGLDLDAHAHFEEWTKTRALFIGTNAGSEPLAFQNWRRFKEAFAPELVRRAVVETSAALGRAVQSCLDPCAGSGTVPFDSPVPGR